MSREERSAGFIIFRDAPRRNAAPGPAIREFLLLDYGRHWDFPKGHLEAGEDDFQAAVRELHEETGIQNPQVIPGFYREVSYFFRHRKHGLVHKQVAFFLARTAMREIILSREHTGYAFLPYVPAMQRLTFATARNVLRFAEEHLAAASR